MRDPQRIEEVLDVIREYWKRVPDWRFVQLLYNVLDIRHTDPFFIEDDDLVDVFKKYFNGKEIIK